MVERVGVREGEVGRCGGFAGMGAGVVENTGVGRGGACGGKLLRHGTELLRRVKGADQLNAACGGCGAVQRMREARARGSSGFGLRAKTGLVKGTGLRAEFGARGCGF